MSIRNDDVKTLLDLTSNTPSLTTYFFLSSTLTLFITLKGWETSVPHLTDLVGIYAHIILHRHTCIGKGWETSVPHLANSTK